MGVELHRDYASLERPTPAARNDPTLMWEWCDRRILALGEALRRDDYLPDAWGGWVDAFTIGILYGWRPAGTEHDDPDWEGGYCSNDGAYVTDADARALGSALELALTDSSVTDARAAELAQAVPSALRELLGDYGDVAGTLQRLLDSDKREDLERYVRFLRRGSFTIE